MRCAVLTAALLVHGTVSLAAPDAPIRERPVPGRLGWGPRPLVPLLVPPRSAPPAAAVERYIPVDTGVRLEVLDWSGSGRPGGLLAGLGNNAHVFDEIARPSVRVVRLPHADRYVVRSNEAHVLRETRAFISSLP
jgi:hypothetical protein